MESLKFDILSFFSFLSVLIGTVWGLSIWLSKQFNNLKDLIYKKVDELELILHSKLENHETQDNKRFHELDKTIWDMRLKHIEDRALLLNGKLPYAKKEKNTDRS